VGWELDFDSFEGDAEVLQLVVVFLKLFLAKFDCQFVLGYMEGASAYR
jgi:hypothetical protein